MFRNVTGMVQRAPGSRIPLKLKKIQSLQWACVLSVFALTMGCASTGKTPNSTPVALINQAVFDRAPQSFQPQLTPQQVERQEADAHFTLAETYSFNGESAKAIEQFKQTLLLDPDSLVVRLRLAAEYVRAGLVSEAIEVGESAVRLNPKSHEARMLLGGLYTGVKLYDQAIEQFSMAYSLDPSNEEPAIFEGAIMAEKGDLKESMTFFGRLEDKKSFQAKDKVQYYLGKVNHEMGGPVAKTEAYLKKALEINPAYRDAALTLAQVQLDRSSKAFESTLLKYQEKNGPDADMARLLARYYLENKNYAQTYKQLEVINDFDAGNPSIQIQMALVSMELRENDRAIELFEQLLVSSPELDKARFYLGALYLDKENREKGMEHLKQIPPASNYFIDARLQISQLYKEEKNLSEAEAILRKSMSERADAPQFPAALAAVLDTRKRYNEARTVLEKASKEFPDDTQVKFFLGSIYDRLGQSDKSLETLKEVVALDGDHVQALNYLAYSLAERGEDLIEAKKMATKALRLSPNDPYIMDTLGWIHFKNGNYKEAQRLVEAAYRQKPDEAVIVEHLGDIYVKTEAWGMALSMYQQAQVLENDAGRAQKLTEKIVSVQDQKQPLRRLPASLPSQ